MRFIHDTGTGHRLMRQTAGCTKQTIALLNNGGQGIYATSRLKHGPLVPHARYWHCYDRSPRAFGPRASVITMPISGMWHSGSCFNLCIEYKGMYCRVILYQVIVSIIEYYSYTVDVHMQQLFIPTVCTVHK